MEKSKSCRDCDWFDAATNCCMLGTEWKEVTPDQEPCEDFVRSEE